MEKPLHLSLSCRGLAHVAAASADDFTFILNGSSFCCPRALAQFISPIVSREHSADQSFDCLEIKTCACTNSFHHIIRLMSGDPIDFAIGEAYSLLLLAESLGNLELCQSLRDLLPSQLNLKNAVTLLEHKAHVDLDCSAELAFIAAHFSAFDRRELATLSPELLQLVLECPDLKVETESDLFRFIQNAVLQCGAAYQVLYETLLFEYLEDADVAAFLQAVTFEELSAPMWAALSRRLVRRTPAPSGDRYSKGTIAYRSDPFDGIAAWMRGQAGGNPVREGLIEVSCSAGNPYGEKLFDKDWKCYWSSANAADQWIAFRFPKHSVVVTDYSLRSPNSKQGWNHLRSWVVEGSMDGKEWCEIDRREGTEELNGKSKVATWKCREPRKVRIVRIRQTGKNHRNLDDIQLSGVEFFGRVFDAGDEEDHVIAA
jgi:hypothetical protein